MTKKDYVAIAEIIRLTRKYTSVRDTPDMRVGGGVATCSVAVRIADYCAGDNDRFDRGRFLRACGVGQ
jgi:hypothetical protein